MLDRDHLGGPVVKTPHFQGRAHGFRRQGAWVQKAGRMGPVVKTPHFQGRAHGFRIWLGKCYSVRQQKEEKKLVIRKTGLVCIL